MKIIIIISVILFAIIFLLWYIGKRGQAYKVKDVIIPIDSLLKRGLNKGFLILQTASLCRFIQFQKYINTNSEYGVILMFPRAKWSVDYFNKLENYLNSEGFDYSRKVLFHNKEDLLYISVDFGKNTKNAAGVAQYILFSLFGIKQKGKCYALLCGATPWNELINEKDINISEPLSVSLKKAGKVMKDAITKKNGS